MNKILRFPGYCLAGLRAFIAFLTILISVIGYVITIPILGNNQDRAFSLRRNWIKFGIKLFGIKLTHIGQPHDQPALYVSNHLSFTDPVATCLYLDAFVIAKAEVSNIPILSRGAELTGVIYVKRESKTSRGDTRKALIDTLQSGKNVLVYPEGTVSQNVTILPYKQGAFREAVANGIPVVPIAINYRDQKDIWNNTGLVAHFFKQLSYWRTHIVHEIGQPIEGSDGEEVALIAHDWTKDRLLRWRAEYPSPRKIT